MLDLTYSLPTAANDPAQAPVEAGAEPAVLPRIGQCFRHYKGSLYRVEQLCSIEASGQAGVLYRAVDPNARQDLWMRPLDDFEALLGEGLARFIAVPEYPCDPLRSALPTGLVPAELLEEVLSRYSAPGRYFHACAHLYQIFAVAAREQIVLTPEQAIALLFHDAVYTAGAPPGLNERLSASYLKDVAPRMGAFDLASAVRFILETADHKATCSRSAVVQDLDLSSLAGTPLELDVANELVWLENRHLLEAEDRRQDFDTRRLTFLLKLAESGPMFHSPALMHLEDAARTNLEGLRRAWMQRYSPK